MESDLTIAQAARLKPIAAIAADLGLHDDDLEPYGRYKAKRSLNTTERLSERPDAKYIVVTAITPTPLGEGKTTTTVGLGQALGKIGKRPLVAIRQASQGPVFTIATKIYGASGVTFEPTAERAIRDFTRLGFDKLPICMAKTHLSLADNPALHGRPSGFTVTIRDVRASVGAGFLYPLAGQMMTIPGLGSSPGGLRVDIDEQGRIIGLN